MITILLGLYDRWPVVAWCTAVALVIAAALTLGHTETRGLVLLSLAEMCVHHARARSGK